MVKTTEGKRLAEVAEAAGGKARVWPRPEKPGVSVRRLPSSRVVELAAEAGIAIDEIKPLDPVLTWFGGRIQDRPTWRARGYFAVKLPLALAGVAAAAIGWVGGLFYLTFPLWWSVGAHVAFGGFLIHSLADSFALLPLGAALLLAGPWLVHEVTEADRRLIRGLLGPVSPAERIRALEESRALAVDDSAARLRGIERDLHDGTQAQLVALAMKLGLAREKLQSGDLARVTQLVDDAHQGILEAITDLRTLARGIHPAVLDKGLADALATLASRSAVPVEFITDISERLRPRSRPSLTSRPPNCSPTSPSTAVRGTPPWKPCTSPACSGYTSPTTAGAAHARYRTAACTDWPNASAPWTAGSASTARAAAPRRLPSNCRRTPER